MKLAYLVALTRDAVAQAHRLGYDGVEVDAGWIESTALDELIEHTDAIRQVLREHRLSVTAVAIYGPTLTEPRDEALDHWGKAMRLARALRCDVVAGLTGRDNALSIDENLSLFADHFQPICDMAEDQGVRVALGCWPGRIAGHGQYDWANLATTPELWDALFQAVPSPALGLEFGPAHLFWQGIDYLRAIGDYAQRIHHVQCQDALLDEDRLGRVGVYDTGWWRMVLPGLGMLDYPAIFAALKRAGYDGDAAVSLRDRDAPREDDIESLAVSLKALRPFIAEY